MSLNSRYHKKKHAISKTWNIENNYRCYGNEYVYNEVFSFLSCLQGILIRRPNYE